MYAGHGEPVTFGRFLRYGLPIAGLTLAVSARYVLVLFFLRRRSWNGLGRREFMRAPEFLIAALAILCREQGCPLAIL